MMILQPAYGRKYKSKKAVLQDFDLQNDFIINDMSSRWDGKPVKKSQIIGEMVQFRYNNNRSTFILKVE